jgi:hypothetical protein
VAVGKKSYKLSLKTKASINGGEDEERRRQKGRDH